MLSQPRPAKPAPAASEPPLARLSLSHLVGYTSGAGLGASGGSHMLDKLRRITLDRAEAEAASGSGDAAAGFKARFRAESLSTTGGHCCCCSVAVRWLKDAACTLFQVALHLQRYMAWHHHTAAVSWSSDASTPSLISGALCLLQMDVLLCRAGGAWQWRPAWPAAPGLQVGQLLNSSHAPPA
jgi:hypothetical protein